MNRFARVASLLLLAAVAAAAAVPPAVDRAAAKLPPGFSGIEPEGFYWKLPDETRDDDESDEAYRERTAKARAPLAGTKAFAVPLRAGALDGAGPCAWRARYDEAARRLVVETNAVSDGRACLVYKSNAPPFQKPKGELAPGEKERKDKAVELKLDGVSLRDGAVPAPGRLETNVDGVDAERGKRLVSGALKAVVVADATGSGDVSLYDYRPKSTPDVEIWVRSYLVVVTKPELWLYDQKSGEILLKKPLLD